MSEKPEVKTFNQLRTESRNNSLAGIFLTLVGIAVATALYISIAPHASTEPKK